MARRTTTDTNDTEGGQSDRQMSRTLVALRLGATTFGVLAGVAATLCWISSPRLGWLPRSCWVCSSRCSPAPPPPRSRVIG